MKLLLAARGVAITDEGGADGEPPLVEQRASLQAAFLASQQAAAKAVQEPGARQVFEAAAKALRYPVFTEGLP